METKRSQGVTSRLAEDGEELMRPYAELSEQAKDLDRNTVRTVFAAMLMHTSEDHPTLVDFYAAQAINGILCAGGHTSSAPVLAEKAFGIVRAMMPERKKYFAEQINFKTL